MSKVNGKSKGSRYEIKLTKMISLWWTDNERDDIFYKSPGSGARFTSRRKINLTTTNQDGDMSAYHEDGMQLTNKLSFEFKHYKDLSLHTLITGSSGIDGILKFWIKHDKMASDINKYPILIAKQNRIPDYILTDHTIGELLTRNNLIRPVIVSYVFGNSIIHLFELSDFLKIPSKEFKEKILNGLE